VPFGAQARLLLRATASAVRRASAAAVEGRVGRSTVGTTRENDQVKGEVEDRAWGFKKARQPAAPKKPTPSWCGGCETKTPHLVVFSFFLNKAIGI